MKLLEIGKDYTPVLDSYKGSSSSSKEYEGKRIIEPKSSQIFLTKEELQENIEEANDHTDKAEYVLNELKRQPDPGLRERFETLEKKRSKDPVSWSLTDQRQLQLVKQKTDKSKRWLVLRRYNTEESDYQSKYYRNPPIYYNPVSGKFYIPESWIKKDKATEHKFLDTTVRIRLQTLGISRERWIDREDSE